MTFRHRITIAAAVAVAVAIASGSTAVYLAIRSEMHAQVDRALVERADAVLAFANRFGYQLPPPPPLGGPGGYVQYVTATGQILAAPQSEASLAITDRARAVAAGTDTTFFSDAHVGAVHVRVITQPLQPGVALQVARPLDEVDRVLGRLRSTLALVMIGGVAIAIGLGGGVARAALAPVDALTDAAEEVARTRDPTKHIDAIGDDEIARLARSFNTMLEALDSSLRAQRQLVADASHELRTPLTSLRTNIEVLTRGGAIGGEERRALLGDVIAQVDEMTGLVGDLVDLARGDEPSSEYADVRLDQIVERVVDKARTHYPTLAFTLDGEPSTVLAVGTRVERAVANLVDNAGKWSPPGGSIEVSARQGEVRVRDHGPGVAPEDLPFIFDRFYRATNARGLPGSGLGLAIVRQVALSHGGSVEASPAGTGDGTVFTLRLPSSAAAD